ncbi:MAG: hypothetical protein KAR35_10720, partial [Candidatus Heimdallarchaeota archaeon]|nr:hypothetical protein [Candidatus Heimdallarchaeota archaeon]
KHHLIIDMLLNTIPLPFIPRCAMVEKDFHNLIGTLELENVTHVNYDGLLAVTGQKPHLKVE